MPGKVLILDTSILCVHLNIPHMDTCGPDNDKWDAARVAKKIRDEEAAGTIFVLPMATLIESGNHITHHGDHTHAAKLAEIIRRTAAEETPWAAFSDQHTLWTPEKLVELADIWPTVCKNLSIGDATIKNVADHYAAANYTVEILTGDGGLKSVEPIPTAETPRRRQRR